MVALLDCDAANLAIEVAEDVVHVGAEVVRGYGCGAAIEDFVGEDGGSATVRCSLWDVSMMGGR